MTKSNVVMVLGMHRAGTSAVAGVLTKLGGRAPKHLMAPNFANAKGYFESSVLMQFHDELLASAGSRWSDWRQFNPDWYQSPAAAEFRSRAKALFAEEFDGSHLAVFKDPRVCRFVPFWLSALNGMEATPHVVMPIRSPLETARSLGERDSLSFGHSLMLWLRHVLDAEFHSRSIARSIFTWQDFRTDWRSTCDRIAAETHLAWPRRSDRATLEIDRFLSKDIVHHQVDEVMHAGLPEWTRRVYEALRELARTPNSNSALATLDDMRLLLDQSSEMFGRLLIENEVALEEARSEATAASAEVQAVKNAHDEMARESEALKQTHGTLAVELQTREQRLADLARRNEEAERERDTTAREKAELTQTLAALTERGEQDKTLWTRQLEAAESGRADLETTGAQLSAELQERLAELAQKEETLAALTTRNTVAENDKNELIRRLNSSLTERNALGRDKDRLAAELAAAVKRAEQEKRDLSLKLGQLSEELTARAKAAENDKSELARRLDLSRAEHEALNTANARLAAELAAAIKQAGQEKRELSLKFGQLSEELTARAAAAENDKNELQQRLDLSLAAHGALDTANARLAAELAASAARAEQEKRDLSLKFNQLSEELTARATTAENDKRELVRRLDLSLAELASERENTAASAASHAELAAAVAQAEQEKRDLSAKFGQLSEELTARAAAAENDKSELVRCLDMSFAERDALDAANVRLTAAAEQAEQEKRDLSAKFGQLSEELTARAAAAADYKSEFVRRLDLSFAERDVLNTANARLAAELAAAVEQAEQEKRDHSLKSGQLTAELQQSREQMNETAALQKAEYSAALAEIERTHASAFAKAAHAHEADLAVLRTGLVDAEAAHANLRTAAKRRGLGQLGWANASPRSVARRLLASGLFETDYYRTQFAEALTGAAGGTELAAARHYVEHGFYQGGRPNRMFDSHWYLDRYEDVRHAGINPLLHYLLHGWSEGRDPGPEFHTNYYLEANPDVAASNGNPLAHYLRYGRHEGRRPRPPMGD